METQYKYKKITLKSNFFFPSNQDKLPPLKIKITKYTKEIIDDVTALEEEKLFHDKLKSKLMSYNSMLRKKTRLPNILKSTTENYTERNNLSLNLSKTNKNDISISPMRKSLEGSFLTQRLSNIRKKVFKLDKISKEKKKTKNNKNNNISILISKKENVNKKEILNKLEDLDKKSLLTNQNLIKENHNYEELILKKIKDKIKNDKKKLFITDDNEFFQIQPVKPFDIKTKRKNFYYNLDQIIQKLNIHSTSSEIIINNMKKLNEKGRERDLFIKEKEIEKRNFEKFEQITFNTEMLLKEIELLSKKKI